MPSSFDYIPSILFMIIQVLCMLTSSLRSLTEMDTKPDSGTGKKKKSEAEAKRSTNSKVEEFVEGSGLSKDEIQVGFKLMAASFDGKWYQGRIVEVDEDDSTFLVHFDFWNSRFDEWYKFTTKKVKPMEDEPRRRNRITPNFKLGDSVIAKWVDGRQYRGKIHQTKPNDMYDVMFEDGVIFSTSVKTLKFGDKLDSTMEDERLTKKEELSKRSKEREYRNHRRSLGPGCVPRLLNLNCELYDIRPSLTAVQHLNNLSISLSLAISLPLNKVYLSYQYESNKNIFTLQGETYNVPSLTHVLGADYTKQKLTTTTTSSSSRESSPEIDIPESSPRKRGRPRIHSPAQLTPNKRTRSDNVDTSCSPPKSKSPSKKALPKKQVLKNVSLSPSSLKPPVKQSPTTRTASVQTDPIEELSTENKTPLPTAATNTPARVEQPLHRPLYPPPPPAPPQQVPSLLQTETVLTSDGRWITIATTPAPAQQPIQIPADVTQRTAPASNVYYQLVPMGANGPIHATTVAPPPIALAPSQPQDPLQSLQQSQLLLAQPTHNPLMMLPQSRPLLQNPSPYLHQARSLLQYQATSSSLPQAPSTVLVHANTLAPLMLPQTALVAPLNVPTQELVPAPQIAQRQTDPPSAMVLTASSPVLPVNSNLVASRATIRLPEVQATVPPIGQCENGENSLISLSSRLPFSSLLSNTTQPFPLLPTTSHFNAASVQTSEVAIATIFAPPSSDPSPPIISIAPVSFEIPQALPLSPGPASPVAPSKPRPNQPQAPSPIETNTKMNSQILHANEEGQELS